MLAEKSDRDKLAVFVVIGLSYDKRYNDRCIHCSVSGTPSFTALSTSGKASLYQTGQSRPFLHSFATEPGAALASYPSGNQRLRKRSVKGLSAVNEHLVSSFHKAFS